MSLPHSCYKAYKRKKNSPLSSFFSPHPLFSRVLLSLALGYLVFRAFVENSPAEMAESTTADTTGSNADTLRLELKKSLTEFLEDGRVCKDRSDADGSFNASKAIDESIRILNRLREVESKKPESEISSSSPAPIPKVPEEFRCRLSNNIMSEPVVIASGQVSLSSISLGFLLDFAHNSSIIELSIDNECSLCIFKKQSNVDIAKKQSSVDIAKKQRSVDIAKNLY